MTTMYWQNHVGERFEVDLPDDAPERGFGIHAPCPVTSCRRLIVAIDLETDLATCGDGHESERPERWLDVDEHERQMVIVSKAGIERRFNLRISSSRSAR